METLMIQFIDEFMTLAGLIIAAAWVVKHLNSGRKAIGEEAVRKDNIEKSLESFEKRITALEQKTPDQTLHNMIVELDKKNDKEHANMRGEFSKAMTDLERRLIDKIETATAQIINCSTHNEKTIRQ